MNYSIGGIMPAHLSIATWIVYILLVLISILFIVDIWLACTHQEMITQAVRDENASTGWLIAGGYLVLGFHLFLLPYVAQLWHKFIG